MPEAANYGIISMIPLTITLIIAFWKRDAMLALFIGCMSGVLILGMDPAFGFAALTQEALGNEDFIWILMIQIFIGIMIAFFMKAGVVHAFAKLIAGKVKSKKGVKVATWFIGLFTVDDYMSPLLRGVVMRPLTDENHIPREKLAFILDSTCSTVCTIIPFMAWGAYVAGLIADLGGPVTTVQQGVNVYIKAIPLNFYAIIMLLIVMLNAFEILPDFGPMRTAEKRARETGKLLRDGAVPLVGTELDELQDASKENSKVSPNVVLDFIVPVIILVVTAVATYFIKGGVKILECFITAVLYLAIEMSVRGVFKDVKDMVETAMKGIKSVMAATIILALAYCINTITKSMGAADFILESTKGWMTPAMFVAATFLIGAIISFFTGSSWGTFAICIPLAVPLAYSFTGNQLGTLVYAAVGAVVSGGLFGDHCSPVSDTTVLSSLGAACDHIDHVRTQLPYAFLAAGISIVLWIIVAVLA
ncbi:MAG: Na+/H+ antiporter NhaC family protein [Anaerovorax sp.]|nr:Na+/H+ antiporter NhaC family protein [Anaerovorax sp.]